jgi:hypothetical protein
MSYVEGYVLAPLHGKVIAVARDPEHNGHLLTLAEADNARLAMLGIQAAACRNESELQTTCGALTINGRDQRSAGSVVTAIPPPGSLGSVLSS